MILTETARYAFEILGFIATFHSETPILTDDLFDRLKSVPRSYGKKIITLLGSHGVLKTRKGIGGGIRLNPIQRETDLWTVKKITDPGAPIDRPESGLAEWYDEKLSQVQEELSQMTILDLVWTESQVETVLGTA